MLRRLAIRDIVLIENLQIEFGSGLSVLTGETGAGKSILLDALSLALGARGDGSLVRNGAQQGRISAEFELPPDHPAHRFLAENDLDSDQVLLIRRSQSADGRTRGYVNDQPVGAGLLRLLGGLLVEIHGQHDDRAMVSAETHRSLLDAFGGLGEQVANVSSCFRAMTAAQDEFLHVQAEIEAATREKAYLLSAHTELVDLNPADGEEEMLSEQRQKMMAAEQIADDLKDALDVVAGSGSPVPELSSAVRKLERKGDKLQAVIGPIVQAFDQAIGSLEDARAHVEQALYETEFDPLKLEQAEERLFALRAAGRKYSVPVSELSALAEKIATSLQAVESGEERLSALQAAAAAAREAYDGAAGILTKKRAAAATELSAAVHQELPALKLGNAQFVVDVTSQPDSPSVAGVDTVRFLVQTNPGGRLGALSKVASGGELSRFMLALKVALADRGSASTLVFDEIDTGAGGAVADAIGERLKRLSARVQVLSVTHAPQVAAKANLHLLIAKSGDDDAATPTTNVAHIGPDDRIEELARMLSGATITDEARAAANQLLGVKG